MWEPTLIKKITAATAGAVAASLGAVPSSVHLALVAVAILVLADTITGITVAVYRRDLKSSKMRSLTVKLMQYAGLGMLGLAITVLTGSWMWLIGALYAVAAIEVLSITENLTKLQRVGVNLGPARGYLERVSRFLADGQEAPDET